VARKQHAKKEGKEACKRKNNMQEEKKHARGKSSLHVGRKT
jgi:hypothetical protein